MWGEKGVLLGSSHSRFNNFQFIYVISDGSGGAIIAWPEITSSQEPRTTSIYHVAKLDSGGHLLWQKDFERVDQLINDGAGGAILDYSPDGEALLVVKINGDGGLPWGEVGVSLPRPGNTRQITSDGLGMVVIVQEELRYPEEAKPGETFSSHHIYAQKINSEGQFAWEEEGVPLYSTPEDTFSESLQVAGDGSGGAIISYYLQEGLCIQKLNCSGEIIWPENGILVTEGDYEGYSIAPDGQGGAVVGWGVGKGLLRSEKAYDQRIGADRKLLWGEEEIRLGK
jgi:hypothetical protein